MMTKFYQLNTYRYNNKEIKVYSLSFSDTEKTTKLFKKVNKKLYIRVIGFTKDTILLETNIYGYYTYFSSIINDNIRDFINELKNVKNDFNLSDEDIKKIEKLLRKLHTKFLKELMIEKL